MISKSMYAASLAAVFTLAGITTACGVTRLNGSSTDELSARRNELRAAVRTAEANAWNTGFVPAVAAVFAPTGFFSGSGGAAPRGAEGARKWLARDTLNATSRARWRTLSIDVSDDGRDGYSYGYLDVFRANNDSLLGGYHAYWRRSDAGEWQILGMARGPRTYTAEPTTLPASATVHRAGPLRPAQGDTVELLRGLFRSEVAFSDSAATSVRAAFMSFAEPEAAKINGSRFVFGREEIGKQFLNPPPGFNGLSWKPDIGTVATSGDLGFTTGPVSRPGANGGPPVASGGRYFTVWRRQPDGSWKYVVD